MTHLYLIRHGEAICNIEPIIGGMKGDTGLSVRGIEQAKQLRDRLATNGKIAADVLISSTLPRARQTAEIIAPAFGLPILWEDDMQEIRVGEADGLSFEEAWSTFGEPHFDTDPFQPMAPGGESWGQFVLRTSTALHRIIRTYQDKTIVIVCHGGIVDVSFSYFLTINTRTPRRLEFYPHNTALTLWETYHYRGQKIWRLACYNDIAHLHTVGAKESPVWSNIDGDKTD